MPKASTRRSKEQVAIEKRLLADTKETEAADLEASIAPKPPKRQRRRGNRAPPVVAVG